MNNYSEERASVTPRKISRWAILNTPNPDADGTLEAHVDYFRGSFEGRSEEFRRALILKLMGNEPATVYKNGKFTDYQGDRGYTEKMVGASGQSIYWRKAESGWDIRVELPGTYLSNYVSISTFCRLLNSWQNMGIRVTRIDLAITDKNKYLKWEDLFNAWENQSCRNCSVTDFYLSRGNSGALGATLSLGSRRSDKYARIYEMTEKHGFAANRIEIEYKGKLCRQVVHELVRNYLTFKHRQDWATDMHVEEQDTNSKTAAYVARVVCGSIEFISRDSQRSNGSTAQLPLLPWWQDFVERVGGRVSVFVERVQTSISRTAEWIKRQVSKSLKILETGLGEAEFCIWLEQTLAHGARKIRDTDSIALGLLYEHGRKALDPLFDHSRSCGTS